MYHGYELRATRLEVSRAVAEDGKESTTSEGNDLQALTMECDRIATSTLGTLLLPLVAAYTLYSFFYEEHTGWYSWLITSASTAVYALGFVLMTPQLFLNYKMKSVAHLPWRVLVYSMCLSGKSCSTVFLFRAEYAGRSKVQGKYY
jgi:hypothetical protein